MLTPAHWIWLPSERCLPNTFVLFRRTLKLTAPPRRATGWITADSRYKLTVNGQRVQWGPAPCDPRWPECDPVDLAAYLQTGENVIGVEVCYFGQGDGTWAMGAPGFIFRLDVDDQLLVSDASWLTCIDRAHRPGMYKRWFLRALQEEFDARLHPARWDTPEYQPDDTWLPAMILRGSANTPAIFAGGPEYVLTSEDTSSIMTEHQNEDVEKVGLRKRSIPLMRESQMEALPLIDAGRVTWKRDPADWFESRMPGCFEIQRDLNVVDAMAAVNEGFYFTYRLPEHAVGFPRFTIEASAGTVVEMMVQESHDPINGPLWLDSTHYHWSRFICREGINHFETFDYESFLWIQLHVRHASAPVRIRDVGIRRRTYDWPNEPHIRCADPVMQKLVDASINTLKNCALETNQDGAGRERQQYSGDCGHQQHAIRFAFGDARHGARYLNTYSQGITLDGYFMDCWPGFDRLARLMQRQMGTTIWGPLLDHGVGFNFDCWNYYMESGDIEALRMPYPRLKRFAQYLISILRPDGLLPVENIGVPAVWIDHVAYQKQSHKHCAFNLYAAAMFQHALANLAKLFGEDAQPYQRIGQEIQRATVAKYWDSEKKLFIIGDGRTCDRSLATAVMFDQCPGGETDAAVQTLAECPPHMGLSYPANAVWRYWALAKAGRTEVIVRDFHTRWATMNSVIYNNALQENWRTRMDWRQQFSHCPLAPLVMLYQCLAGIRPTKPGFAECEIRPQLADFGDVDLIAHTPRGPIHFIAVGENVQVQVPRNCVATLVSPNGTRKLIGK